MGPLTLTWYAADLSTGVILEELQGLSVQDQLGRTLGASASSSLQLALAGAPPAWVAATTPGRTMLVAVDTEMGQPLWAGLILQRQRGSDPTCSLSCATPEAYFDRRYTGDYTAAVATDQALIMTGVASALAVSAPCFTFDAPSTGTLATYTVADSDDRTILSCWQELMGMEGGAEWTVDVAWADAAQTRFVLPIRIRPVVGFQDVPEVFDFPGCVTSYQQTEDYTSGNGANSVMAYGSGQGASRVKSAVHTDTAEIAAGWPIWALRTTPAQASVDPVALDAAAAQALAQMSTGTSTWTAAATASQAPRLGTDWALGDAIRLIVQPGSSEGHPDGADVTGRAYGWTLAPDSDQVTPVLVEGDD